MKRSAAGKKTRSGRNRRRMPLRGNALLLLAVMAVGVYFLSRPSLSEMRKEQDRLRVLLRHNVARDSLFASAPAGDIGVGLRWNYAQRLVEQLTAKVIDRARLQVEDLHLAKSGAVRTKTPFGRVRVGNWRLRLDVHRISGILRTGRPSVAFEDERNVAVRIPVTLRDGQVSATLRFGWDAGALASLVCRDFRVQQDVEAVIIPQEQSLSGALLLKADGEAIVVQPRIRGQRLRMRLRPTKRSWARARSALQSQDSFWRCGIALSPEDVLSQLRAIVDRGIRVRLPTIAPGAIRVPIRFRRSIGVGRHRVELMRGTGDVSITTGAIWYSLSLLSRSQALVGAEAASRPRIPKIEAPSIIEVPEMTYEPEALEWAEPMASVRSANESDKIEPRDSEGSEPIGDSEWRSLDAHAPLATPENEEEERADDEKRSSRKDQDEDAEAQSPTDRPQNSRSK
jgi:hypothetical protein